jgi:hypothetical protein
MLVAVTAVALVREEEDEEVEVEVEVTVTVVLVLAEFCPGVTVAVAKYALDTEYSMDPSADASYGRYPPHWPARV